MKDLLDIITALQRTFAATLEKIPHSSTGFLLQPERFSVALQMEILEDKARAGADRFSFVVANGSVGSGAGPDRVVGAHLLTIDFRLSPGGKVEESRSNGQVQKREHVLVPPPTLEGSAATFVSEQLAQILGPPGFDSSARATVVREVCEGLSDAQVMQALAGLASGPNDAMDSSVRRARHHLANVVRSGPLKSLEAARLILEEVFGRHGTQPVLALVKEQWKTQQDWNAGG